MADEEAPALTATHSVTFDASAGAASESSGSKARPNMFIEGYTPGSCKNIFVDYTPPPDAHLLPPAKWKLYFITLALVYGQVTFGAKAAVPAALQLRGWFSPQMGFFLFLGMVMSTMVYAALDLLVELFTFQRNGKLYGVAAWLNSPRVSWPYKYSNFFAEATGKVIRILEDGFAMFDAPTRDHATKSTEPKAFTKTYEGEQYVELKVEHRIRPDKMKEYQDWVKKFEARADQEATGFVKIIVANTCSFRVVKRHQVKEDTKKDGVQGMYFSSTLLFEDIESLNEWMLSPRRKVLMDELKKLLVEPPVAKLQMDRNLPDAMSDLFAKQGAAAPSLPPQKWKVCLLATIAIYISILWANHFMAHYYEFWGLSDPNKFWQKMLVELAIEVFINDYIMVPLMLFFFDEWLYRERVEKVDLKQPWKTFNEGFPSIWWRFGMVAIYCLICALLLVYFQP